MPAPYPWYSVVIHGRKGVTYLSPEQVADLRARGLDPKPAEPPPDLAERIGALLAGLVRLSS